MSKSINGTPISYIVAGLMIVIALFGWGVLAGSYAGEHKEIEQVHQEFSDLNKSVASAKHVAKFQFFTTVIQQLPNFTTFIAWNVSHRKWLLILFISLEAIALLLGMWMKKVEREWVRENRKY